MIVFLVNIFKSIVDFCDSPLFKLNKSSYKEVLSFIYETISSLNDSFNFNISSEDLEIYSLDKFDSSFNCSITSYISKSKTFLKFK